jgi:putative phosphonate metabolism protein
VHSRYALYHLPAHAPLASFAARWLGWDPVTAEAPAPAGPIAGLPRDPAALTQAARKYGFHATLKAPFRLAPGQDEAGLSRACSDLADRLPPVELAQLVLTRIGGFLALTAEGDQSGLNALAAAAVADLDGFRAPLSAADIARRRPDNLTPQQRTLLLDWGYPYVMEEFRFHMTLTGDLPPAEADQTAQVLLPLLQPLLPRPYVVDALCLMGEDAQTGRFRLLSRHPLRGRPVTASRAT